MAGNKKKPQPQSGSAQPSPPAAAASAELTEATDNKTPVDAEPEYIPGAASLSEELDKQLLVVLRDGRLLLGWLRSYDQFGTLVLEHTCELIVVRQGSHFGTIDLGILVIRGENIVVFGDVPDDYLEVWEADHARLAAHEAVTIRADERREDEEKKQRSRAVLAPDFQDDLMA